MLATFTPSASSQEEVDISKIRLMFFSNELPFDNLQELFRGMHNLSKQKHYWLLARFFDEATVAVREEVEVMPASSRNTIPPFDTVLNLAEYLDLRKTSIWGSIEGVLLILVELGTLLMYVSL